MSPRRRQPLDRAQLAPQIRQPGPSPLKAEMNQTSDSMVMFHAVWKKDDLRGSVRVFGELVAPGLVIAPAVDAGTYHGSWSLVHIESGMALSYPPMCLRHVRKIVGDVVALGVDWTRDMATVIDDPKAKQAARIHSATGQDCAYGYQCDDGEMDWRRVDDEESS